GNLIIMLFISSNSKIEALKNILQPLLKFKVIIERDFDCGMNVVFEMRPDVVFIQDQIDGVTGESVANHIKLLLGSEAPSFVFMHDGDTKATSINELHGQLIDLSRTEAKVLADIKERLKVILGPQWETIYIEPKTKKSADETSQAEPEECSDVFSQCLHDFIPEIEPIGPASSATISLVFDFEAGDISPRESFQIISSTDDQLAEIISEEAREQERAEAVTAADVDVATEEAGYFDFTSTTSSVPAVGANDDTASSLCKPGAVPSEQRSPNLSANVSVEKKNEPVEAPEKVRWAFEGEPSLKAPSSKRHQVVKLLLVLCLVTGGWHLVNHEFRSSQSHVSAATSTKVLSAGQKAVGQKIASDVQQPEPSVLPSFVPLSGLDRTFAPQNPGWERYVGDEAEFRLFRSAGKVKAVQVKASEGHVISDPLLRSILVELTGSGEYRVTSREEKLGFKVSHATVKNSAEMLIYRKRSAVVAVVVSLQ